MDDDSDRSQDRRYILFAVGLACVVLLFAAVSITVVLTMSH